MKNAWNILVFAIIASATILTACGKGGGGNASTPSANAYGCVYDSAGNCSATVGPAGYVGDGQWGGQYGRLQVSNPQAFMVFAQENRLCSGSECNYISNYMSLMISLRNGGCLPGSGQFSIQTFMQGRQGRTLSDSAAAYNNAGSNGFMIDYKSGGSRRRNYDGYDDRSGRYDRNYQQADFQTNSGNLGQLRIDTQFTDGYRNLLNVQVYYRGTQIAAGQLSGYSQYSQNGGAANVNSCTSGGYGGFGGGYANGGTYSPIGYGGGYLARPIGIYSGYGRRY